MENLISLKEFLDEYGESMAQKVTEDLTVVHDPATEKEEGIERIIEPMTKKPFPSQGEIVKACYKSLITGNKAVYMVCEMGTGKTLMAVAVAELLHRLKGARRVLVVCPPHLVPKWIQEIKDSLPGARAYNLNGRGILRQLKILRKQPKPLNLEFYVVGRERAKTGFLWRPAVVTRQGKYFCPKCGGGTAKQGRLPPPDP
jgi:SNF2 family DNA or RNA helicase